MKRFADLKCPIVRTDGNLTQKERRFPPIDGDRMLGIERITYIDNFSLFFVKKEYWGKICQYEDECGEHSQCGSHGKCVYMGGSNLPRRQCFCEAGYFGYKCSRFAPDLPYPSHSLNLTSHTLQVLSDKMIMYHKVRFDIRYMD